MSFHPFFVSAVCGPSPGMIFWLRRMVSITLALGMIVPKKILATAVARNRVKRLIREVFSSEPVRIGGT
jgi:ribonuclease P protein component